MNDHFDFDALAREVAGGFSRREALRRLGMGLAAGLLAELTGWLPIWPTARAAAASVAPSSALCFPEIVTKGSLTSWIVVSSTLEQAVTALTGCPACSTGQLCCGRQCCNPDSCCSNVCVGIFSDPNNCGKCGNACAAGESCGNGSCFCSAAFGNIIRCSPEERCDPVRQACVCGPSGLGCADNQLCCGGSCCAVGESCVNGSCGCGSRGHHCASGQCCSGGTCVAVNLQNDPNNCGACGFTCATTLPNGRTLNLGCCAGRCTDGENDPSNCGGCGIACPAGETCTGGKCAGVTCPLPGQHPCGLVCCASTQVCCVGNVNAPCCDPGKVCCGSVCADLSSDPKHCGACGTFCGSAQICSNGLCCAPGQTGCGGACVSLATDVNNCGACGHHCPGGEICVNGHCTCGSLGADCPSGEVCCNGICCAGAQVCCNGRCVNTASDVSNCGGCGNVCPTPANSKPVCTAGVCGFNCIPPFAHCANKGDTGCDTNTHSDTFNCGTCGNSCFTVLNALITPLTGPPSCCGGACVFKLTDSHNCGSCGNNCGTALGFPIPCVGGLCAG